MKCKTSVASTTATATAITTSLKGLFSAQSVASFAASASNFAPDATLAAAHVG